LDASATILILHFFLYVLGVIPFSPTRHSLYLTVPLTVIGVVGINHLIFTYEILYPKLINPIFNLFVLILALACAYLNISYILERKDPFDEVKVLELLTSRETPAIIINSDWTYQHYEIPQVSKVKLLLDLNLSSKRDKFNEQLEKVRPVIGSLNNGDTIKLIRISHWRPLNIDNTQVEIKDIICKHFKYNCLLDTSNELFSSTNKVSSEWVNNIQGFSNSLYIDTLSIYVIGSSSKN
jgi:prepilin signal peptidase PulO-like enzyme (type II secretory pathway)